MCKRDNPRLSVLVLHTKTFGVVVTKKNKKGEREENFLFDKSFVWIDREIWRSVFCNITPVNLNKLCMCDYYWLSGIYWGGVYRKFWICQKLFYSFNIFFWKRKRRRRYISPSFWFLHQFLCDTRRVAQQPVVLLSFLLFFKKKKYFIKIERDHSIHIKWTMESDSVR